VTATRLDTQPTIEKDQDGQALIREARRRQRRRRLFLGLVALALALVVAVALLPGSRRQPPDAAARFLDQLARRAGQQVTTLKPGQYHYTEVQTQVGEMGGTFGVGGPTYLSYTSGTAQTWIARDSSGRQVDTIDPIPHFYTDADQRAWVAAEKPPVPPPATEPPTVQAFGPHGAWQVQGPIRLYDMSRLPIDTSISSQSIALRNVGVVTNCSRLACTVFARATSLLQGPVIGATAARRSALFGLLAQVPGVKLLGTVTDRDGRVGIGFEIVEEGSPGGTFPYTCEKADGTITTKGTVRIPPSSVTYVMVVDPKTTAVLSTSERFSDGSAPVTTFCSGPRVGQVAPTPPRWTLLLGSGIVDSETSTPTS
jgi:hypothetical protein